MTRHKTEHLMTTRILRFSLALAATQLLLACGSEPQDPLAGTATLSGTVTAPAE